MLGRRRLWSLLVFFFNDPATTETYTLSLHDALPIYSPPRGLLADNSFREGFAVLARLRLSFDAWLFHPQIDELADLARAFPDAMIVLNHVGGPIGIGAYGGRHKEVFP